MKRDTGYLDYVLDLMTDIPGIYHKGMFSGFGLYKDGIFFAIISDGQLYFKVDQEMESQYKSLGSEPFTYEKPKTKQKITMSYWQVPEEVMEDREKLFLWVEKAVEASFRAGKNKK